MSKLQVSAATIERLRVLMLDDKPRSCLQVSAELGFSRSSADHAMTALHKRGLVHVERYERCDAGTSWIRIFKWGTQRDAPRPSSLITHSHAYLRRERERLSQSRATKVFRHPWDVWLFVECATPPKTKWTGRVIRQSMSAHDEDMEAMCPTV